MRAIREWIHRIAGTVTGGRRDSDLEQELRAHLSLAIEQAEREGHGPAEAARLARIRAGSVPNAMDALRSQRGAPWIEALRADVVFGWRQLRRRRTVTAAAIISLGLALGAATATFRLVDAVLLRTLPVAEPHRLWGVASTYVDSQNRPDEHDYFDYPTFRRYRTALGDRAESLVIGMSAQGDATFDGAEQPEPIYRQYLSGNAFTVFGLRPAVGRLLLPSDDETPGAHAVVVISYHLWSRRFARDPGVVGRALRLGLQRYEIVGVSPEGFTGTEPGRLTDIFIPAMMNVQALNSPGWSWFRMWVRPNDGINAEQVRQTLQSVFEEDVRTRVRNLPQSTSQQTIDAHLRQRIVLRAAGSGVSGTQKEFRLPLFILAVLVTLILLIACANVANLLIAQGMARGREMALRVSLGAGRARLIQLVLVESALLAGLASVVGALFAWWSAPLVVAMLAPPEEPVRLILDLDWRVLAFGSALTASVTGILGLLPALRASAIDPLGGLKGADDPGAHRRLTGSLIAAQMAFCTCVLFVAVMFATTFERLLSRPLGFTDAGVLVAEVEIRGKPQPADTWNRLADELRQTPGIEAAAFAGWTFLSGNRWRGGVRHPNQPFADAAPYFLEVSGGFFATMRIEMIEGREFRPGDRPPAIEQNTPVGGVGIVNQAFARAYFGGRSPIGAVMRVRQGRDTDAGMTIVGYVRDTVYASLREPMRPVVYVPIGSRGNGSFVIRTAEPPAAVAAALRRAIGRPASEAQFDLMAHSALVRRQMIRERLLASLSGFFAVLGLLLASVGLYGVLSYAVVQRRREIGVRMALGARAADVVRRVAAGSFAAVTIGALGGLAGGFAIGRIVDALLFQIKATDPRSVAIPLAILIAIASLAAVRPAIRAVRTDPARVLRTE
jgi:predicted permease